MAELQDTDQFLVNRSDSTYQLEAQNLMAELLDDDLMLVNREGVTYKATGQEIKDSLDNAVPVTIETVVVTEDEPGVSARFTSKGFTTAVNCDIKSAEPIVFGLKAKSEGRLVKQAKTSVITGTIPPEIVEFLFANTGSNNTGPFEDNKNLPIGSVVIFDLTGETYAPSGGSISGEPELVWKTTTGEPITNMQISLVDTGQTPGRDVWVSEDGISWTFYQKIRSAGTFTITGTFTYVLFHGGPGNQTTEVPSQLDDATVLELTDPTGLSEFSPSEEIVQNGGGTPVSSAITNVNPTLKSDTPAGGIQGNVTYKSPRLSDSTSSTPSSYIAGDAQNTNVAGFEGVTGVNSIRIYANARGGSCGIGLNSGALITIPNIGGTTSGDNAPVPSDYAWYDLSNTLTIPSTLESLSCKGSGTGPGNIIYIWKIEVNGVQLTNDDNARLASASYQEDVLTLTDDTNLANFRAGDVVQGANVVVGSAYEARYADGRDVENVTWDSATFAENLTVGQAPTADLVKNIFLYDFKSPVSNIEFVRFAGQLSDPTYVFKMYVSDDGTTWTLVNETDSINGDTTSNYAKFVSSTPARYYKIFRDEDNNGMNFDRYGFATNITQAKITAIDEDAPSITVDGGSWTGTDGTGDTTWDQSEVWSRDLTGNFESGSLGADKAFDGRLDTQAVVNPNTGGDLTCTWTGSISVNTSLRFKVAKISSATPDLSTNLGDAPTTVVAPGSATEWTSVPGAAGKTLTTFSIFNEGAGIVANTYLSAVEVDGKLLVDTGVSGGPETFVTGPALAAAEGTVSSVDAAATPPTLTVSGSTGRWLVTEADYQEDLKLNKVAQSRDFVEVDNAELFAIFDAEGNISDMSGTDPGYRDMVSTGTVFETFNLEFPSLFSNGKTPDETLPSGATLCVDVKATNISGEDTKLDTCVTPEDPDPEPTAVMSGLRFSGDVRKIKLTNSLNGGSKTTFTISTWIKPSLSKNDNIISYGNTGNNRFWVRRNTSGEVQVTYDSTNLVGSISTPVNTWFHVVVQVDTTLSTSADRIRLYINGVKDSLSGTQPGNINLNVNSGERCRLGEIAWDETANSSVVALAGYLSEFFVVEGQALLPETFGYDYENQGKWAPLDSAVIKQNIVTKTPEFIAAFPDDQYDTSQVWSNGTQSNPTLTPNRPLSFLFDGNLSTVVSSPDTNVNPNLITLSNEISVTNKLEIYATTAGNPSGPYVCLLDGVEQGRYTPSGAEATDWREIPGMAGKSFNQIQISRGPSGDGSGGFSGSGMAAIRVEDKILVAAPSFGANGFYLPFDPTNTGANYSSDITVNSGNGPNSSTYNGPNGAFINRDTTERSGLYGESGDWQFNFNPPIPITNSCILGNSVSGGYTIAINGQTIVASASENANGAEYFGAGNSNLVAGGTIGSELSTISFTGDGTVSAGCALYFVEIDGVTLINHNNIGVDNSGNGNNFHDQNFAVGDASQVWSKYLTNVPMMDDTTSSMAFDGSIISKAHFEAGATIVFTPPTSLQSTTSVEAYVSFSGNVSVNGGGDEYAGVKGWKTLSTGSKEVTRITFTPEGSGWSVWIYAIRIDGVLLIDGNIADTVTDTPLKSYATLLTGSNGNLVATGNSSTSYLGEVGTDYYYEENGGGKVHTGGAAFASTDGKTYNFGQQPFATQYDDSQVWSDNTNVAGSYLSSSLGPTKMFNGVLSERTVPKDGSTVTWELLPADAIAGNVRLWMRRRGTTSVFTVNDIDYRSLVTSTLADDVEGWVTIPETSLHKLVWTRIVSDNYTDIGGVEVAGSILVDTGNPLAAAYDNTLFQKWSEWNNVSLMLATNPAHVARFNTMKAAMDAFPAERTAYRRSLLTSIVASGLSTQQKVYLLTEGSDGNVLESGPFARDGYFPLYDTEEVSDNASSTGESHSHIIDGITYFMPDAGQTIYHGNYESNGY